MSLWPSGASSCWAVGVLSPKSNLTLLLLEHSSVRLGTLLLPLNLGRGGLVFGKLARLPCVPREARVVDAAQTERVERDRLH